MGQGGYSGGSGAPGDGTHRPSVVYRETLHPMRRGEVEDDDKVRQIYLAMLAARHIGSSVPVTN